MSINEELSFTEYTLTEDTTDFIISFDRIGGSTDEVSILVNNTPIEDLVGYTVLQVNFSTWQVDPALPAGTVVRLVRTTNLDKMVYVFTAGAKFIAKNVDSNFKQIQHSQQEIRDRQDKLEGDATALLLEISDVKVIAEQAAADANEALEKVDEILNTGVVPAGLILTNSGQNQQQVNDFGGAKWYAKVGGYELGAEVRLDNGDRVHSTIAGNTNNPNVDITGWVRSGNTLDVESIAEMLAIQNPNDGMRVYVKSYHSGLNKGGGTFVYKSSKSAENDGVVTFNGWVRASFMFVTSSMAGCIIDGLTDDTVALQRGVDYTAQNGFPLYVDEGTHYLNTATFKRWGSDHNYQTYCPIIELKYNNISIIGKSEKSVLKYGDGVTYVGWEEIGYVGAQLFSASPALQIDNFELFGCTIDGNGYNNKIRGLNGGGTSAGSQAVAIMKGDNTRIVGNKFKDLSGYQALFIAYDTENTLVENNEFVDTGWLDGTNWTPNYTDQSTIFLGGTYLCRNNKLIQSYDGMFAGTACELHGVGTAIGNYVEKYASSFLSAAVVRNSRTTLLANSVIDCTMFLGTDTQNSWNNYVSASGNYFRQRTLKIDENTIYGKYRAMIYFFGAYAPTSCFVSITGNTFDTDGLYVDSTDAYLKTNNSVVISQEVTAFTFSNNVIRNHKGHFLRLLRQKDGIIYTVSNNTFDNCGVDNSTDLGNSIVYFDNDGDQAFGVRPAEINFANNTFKACKYGQYFGGALDVAGEILCPYSFVVDNDVHDNWLTTLRVKSGFQVNFDFYNEYNYKVNSTYNAAKDINGYAGGYNAVNQRGEIKFIENGVAKSFKKTSNSFLWTQHNAGVITLSATYDPAPIPTGTQIEYVFNDVVGVTLGMSATPTFDKFLSGVQMWAQVTAPQQVVVYFRNGTAAPVDIPTGTLRVDVR